MTVQKYHYKDCKKIVELFYDTIHSVNAADYNKAQLDAWAPPNMDLCEWNNKLSNNYSVVVEKNNMIIGFGIADDTGYFDLLYVHKDYQGMGVATLIGNDIEEYFHCKGTQIITTAASITAKPFFEKRGYLVLQEQNVECRGQIFINFKMQKKLR